MGHAPSKDPKVSGWFSRTEEGVGGALPLESFEEVHIQASPVLSEFPVTIPTELLDVWAVGSRAVERAAPRTGELVSRTSGTPRCH